MFLRYHINNVAPAMHVAVGLLQANCKKNPTVHPLSRSRRELKPTNPLSLLAATLQVWIIQFYTLMCANQQTFMTCGGALPLRPWDQWGDTHCWFFYGGFCDICWYIYEDQHQNEFFDVANGESRDQLVFKFLQRYRTKSTFGPAKHQCCENEAFATFDGQWQASFAADPHSLSYFKAQSDPSKCTPRKHTFTGAFQHRVLPCHSNQRAPAISVRDHHVSSSISGVVRSIPDIYLYVDIVTRARFTKVVHVDCVFFEDRSLGYAMILVRLYFTYLPLHHWSLSPRSLKLL